jgi:hypothetical protein
MGPCLPLLAGETRPTTADPTTQVVRIAEGRPRWPMVDRRALDRAPRGVSSGRTVGEETQRQGERRHEAGGKDAHWHGPDTSPLTNEDIIETYVGLQTEGSKTLAVKSNSIVV